MSAQSLVTPAGGPKLVKGMNDIQEARQAVKAIIRSASECGMSEQQASSLLTEARTNAQMAFGPTWRDELTAIIVAQVAEVYERGAVCLQRFA